MSRFNFISLTGKWGKRLAGVSLIAGCTLLASASSFYGGSGGDKKKDTRKADSQGAFTFSNLKNTLPLSLKVGMQPGLQFTGDFNSVALMAQSISGSHSLITYQKGNTIYIVPYKQNLLLSKFKTPERILR